MISEEQQDQAALYALGLLDADEAAAFERAVEDDPELGRLALELRDAASSVAHASAPEESAPSAGLKARLLAEVERREPVVLAPPVDTAGGSPAKPTALSQWLLAAAAVVVIFLGMGYMRQQNELRRAQVIAARERSLANARAQPLRQVAVCQLEPTPDSPDQPRAAIVWDPARHEGKLIIAQLKPPVDGHDYQLWAVEAGHADPVSAGLVHVDAGGRTQVEFRPVDAGSEKVAAFALSLEPAGGSEKARGPILLLGKL